MSIDEVCLRNGELYTVITNKDKKGKKGALAALIKGTKHEVVTRALEKVPISIRMGVKEITADLASTMDWICRTNFPNATLVADRFHFQGIIHEAVQEVRIYHRREAIDEENKLMEVSKKNKTRYIPYRYSNGDTKKQLLARSRYLLFKSSKYWADSQKERAKILFENFPQLKLAYTLSMTFRDIFEKSKTREYGKTSLNSWYKEINKSDVSTLISSARTIKNNEGKILNYFNNRSTNASAESFNAKLKGFRSLLRGIRDTNFYLFRVEKLFA